METPPVYNTVNFFVIVKGGAAGFLRFVEQVFDAHENKAVRTPDKDGTLIHAEIQLGNAMILVADSKAEWPFTPAFPQVYVDDAQSILKRAEDAGAEVITTVTPFYGGLNIARFRDPWHNIWWLFEKGEPASRPAESTTDWHRKDPSYVYTSLMDAMRQLRPPEPEE